MKAWRNWWRLIAFIRKCRKQSRETGEGHGTFKIVTTNDRIIIYDDVLDKDDSHTIKFDWTE